jgi:hypothetical protein
MARAQRSKTMEKQYQALAIPEGPQCQHFTRFSKWIEPRTMAEVGEW